VSHSYRTVRGVHTLPRGAFENQDDLVERYVSDRETLVQPTGSAGSVTPPTVRATAHDVRSINDENHHPGSVRTRLDTPRS